MNISKTSLSIIVTVIGLSLVPTISVATISHLTILYTNNHYGHAAQFAWNGIPGAGGIAARSTLINRVRADVEQAGGHVLLLSASGVNLGPPELGTFDAEPDFTQMTLLEYDAMALGARELEHPREVLMQQQEWAAFPFLSANIVHKATGEPLVDPALIKNVDDFTVAIFGVTQERVCTVSVHAEDLESRSAIDTAQALVPRLRNDADLVIALTPVRFHEMSGDGDGTPGAVTFATAVPGIDVVIGGQVYDQSCREKTEIIGDTLIVQAGGYGLYVGRLDLSIDRETKTITDYTHTVMP